MNIHLENIGKKFRNEWIFRGVNVNFKSKESWAITGPNGSGKSTLMQVIAGVIPHNTGNVIYKDKNLTELNSDTTYRHFFYSAPYIDLIEEFSPVELFNFQSGFREFEDDINLSQFLENTFLNGHENKEIRQFSSGMKQRLKLGLAFFSKSDVILLDEPTTNLDLRGIDWYLSNMEKLIGQKTIIISSNDKKEYDFCSETLDISVFKSGKNMPG